MVSVKREGIVLEGTLLDFENEGVMNPAVQVTSEPGVRLSRREWAGC